MPVKERGLFLRVFYRVLHFFKLLNHKEELSLTNIAFWIFLYKIAFTNLEQMTVGDLATALSVVGLYFGTKVLNRGYDQPDAKQVIAKAVVNKVAEKVKDAAEDHPTQEEENGDC